DIDIPSGHVPHTHVAVAAAADQNVVPRHHGPDAHDVALQSLLVTSLGVEDVDFGVVEGNDNVFVGQMQASDDANVRGDPAVVDLAAMLPGGVDHVALLEVRAVRRRRRTPAAHAGAAEAVDALGAEVGGAAEAGAGQMRVAPGVAVEVGLIGRGAGGLYVARERLSEGVGGLPVEVLVAECLPGSVVHYQSSPALGNLRGSREGLRIVDEGK